MDSFLDFKIFQPKGLLVDHVQAIWSASVPQQNSCEIKKWLHSDACSGILFNLNSAIHLDNTHMPSEIFYLPVSTQAQQITLPPGAQVAGIRFHPGKGYGFLGENLKQPTPVESNSNSASILHPLNSQLMKTSGHAARISTLYRWLRMTISHSELIPESLNCAINSIQDNQTPGQMSDNAALSLRQLERQFKRWVGISPKHYQRIIRIKKTLDTIKLYPYVTLADLAHQHGFTDQAHMTREFKKIAKITPGAYSKVVVLDQTALKQ